MATLASLQDRLRFEIGDIGKSFVWQTVADGTTNRLLVPYNPIDGLSLVIHVNNVDVSTTTLVEEETGYITLLAVPTAGQVVVVAGTYFRFFTNTEIGTFVSTAFAQHTAQHADNLGRGLTLTSLPGVEEYPVVIYAATLALYTLATDASFDINVFAPDGVTIPRSERYQQLMQMISTRKEQYKEICALLGIGLYKIDVFTLRRVSKSTNFYVPVYLPMEVDDVSTPTRVLLPVPTYGNQPTVSDVPNYDIIMYQGDSYSLELDFPFDIAAYTFKAQIASLYGAVNPLVDFTATPITVAGVTKKLILSLTSAQTTALPERAYWDIQAKLSTDITYEKTYMRGSVFVTRQVTM